MGGAFREMLRGGFHPSETIVAEKTLQSFAGRLKDVSQQSFTQHPSFERKLWEIRRNGKLKSSKQNNTLGFLNGIINHYLPPTGLPLMSAQRFLMLGY